MAFHQFGMMENAPRMGERFDQYEPEKYRCIAVKDALYDRMNRLIGLPITYWHGLDFTACGLNETGITLIPPDTAGFMAERIKGDGALSPVRTLLVYAVRTQKWIIHFGI